jgi:hypothetical protein
LCAGKAKAGMYPTHDVKARRQTVIELSRGAGEHKPIKEPDLPIPVDVPPIIKRPPKNDPNEPSEPPLQDPSPQPPFRSQLRDCPSVAKGSERFGTTQRETFLVTNWKADSKRCSFAR